MGASYCMRVRGLIPRGGFSFLWDGLVLSYIVAFEKARTALAFDESPFQL